MTPLAHVGHLLIDIPLFLGPVVVLVIALMWSSHRERKREKTEPREEASA